MRPIPVALAAFLALAWSASALAAMSPASILPISGFGLCTLGGCPTSYTGTVGGALAVAPFLGGTALTTGTVTWQVTSGSASPMTGSGLTFTFLPLATGSIVVSATINGLMTQPLEIWIFEAPQSMDLSEGRVRVSVDWQNPYSGESGTAYGIPQQDSFVYFYYQDPRNPEVFVKVLDFEAGSALCFVGGLTDFYYKVTFTALRTGQKLVFEKPPYQYIGFVDNSTLKFAEAPGMTFAGALPTGEEAAEQNSAVAPPPRTAAAGRDPEAFYLLTFLSGRIWVTVDFRNPYSGETGHAYGIPKSDKFAFFYYTDPDNPEVFVKLLDFGAGSALVFVGGLTDFYYKVTFTVLRTGQQIFFEKPEYQYVGFVDNSTLKF